MEIINLIDNLIINLKKKHVGAYTASKHLYYLYIDQMRGFNLIEMFQC